MDTQATNELTTTPTRLPRGWEMVRRRANRKHGIEDRAIGDSTNEIEIDAEIEAAAQKKADEMERERLISRRAYEINRERLANCKTAFTPQSISDEDYLHLWRIFGVKDPGIDVSRVEFIIDWPSITVETRFTYPALQDGDKCMQWAEEQAAKSAT